MRRTLVAFAAAAICMTIANRTFAQDWREKIVPSITVVGTGEVDARPDLAEVTLGVVVQAESATEAMKQNNERMEKLFQLLKDRGIEDRDIQTAGFHVTPQYEHSNGRREPKIQGYEVTNLVRVRLRRLSAIGRMLDEALKAGANRVVNIQFTVDNKTQFMDRARENAMQDALRRAELYARQAGVELGEPLLVQEQEIRFPQPIPYGRMMATDAAMSGGAAPIAAGEQTLTATVTVTYSMGPNRRAAEAQAEREANE